MDRDGEAYMQCVREGGVGGDSTEREERSKFNFELQTSLQV